MADQPDQADNETETPASTDGADATDAPATDGAETAESAPAEAQTPAAEAGAETPAGAQTPAAEAGAEAPAPDATDGEAQAAASEAAPAPAPAEPQEQLSPKQRRRQARARRATKSAKPRSPEERHAERVVERRAKAVRRRARRLQERAKAVERRASAPAQEPLPPVHAPTEGTRKLRQGIVVSDKADKTITVRIDVARRHRRYEKIVRSSGTLHAHDENNEAHEGDVVRVIESRPLSRTKRWRLVDVLERAR